MCWLKKWNLDHMFSFFKKRILIWNRNNFCITMIKLYLDKIWIANNMIFNDQQDY